MPITIRPIRADFLLKAREAGLDDQNQPVVRLLAKGGEPCRDVLRKARPGEALILASYCPFSVPGPYKEYGAVYILAQASNEAVRYDRFPLPTGSPLDYLRDKPFVLRAYSADERIVDAELLHPAQAEAVLARFFANPEVSFVLARFAAYGCYALRIDRPAS
ncbi:DUF1203 domain-containing protein [Chitinilyticum litopenaei]|uniref:DUF1203 domain-containing protein n=1 Tax=Chitinilyticum litopenaei TaxID=1121276 RepID=UPI0009DBA678|nr:DUF1203 domain-containing protein [Chitinilyticum litopenaei]